jgi:hypothetical protein
MKITLIAILLSLLRPCLMFAEPLTGLPESLSESGTRLYSDLEVGLLIDEISEAALEAIEQAAGEAAKAAVLSMVEREAILLRETQRWRIEAETLSQEVTQARRAGRKNTVLGVVIGILGGLAVGVTGTIIIGGR